MAFCKNYKVKEMKKIILVESDPKLVDIYRRTFEKTDFDVELASKKDEMLEELRDIRTGTAPKPDLVILDFMLADGNGVEILKAIKKHIITKDIPVFAVTNYQNRDFDRDIAKQNIAPEKYLIKANHTPAELLNIIHDHFNRSAAIKPTLS